MTSTSNWDITPHVYTVDLTTERPQSASVAVLRSVAALTDRSPESLDPLWESVNPDALDGLVNHSDSTTRDCCVTFWYEGCRVEVVGEREIRLVLADEHDRRNVACQS